MVRIDAPPTTESPPLGRWSETIEQRGEVDPAEQLVTIHCGCLFLMPHVGTDSAGSGSSGFETVTLAKRTEAASSSASTT